MKGPEGVAYHKQCIQNCQVVSGIFEILVASKNSGPVFMQGASCYHLRYCISGVASLLAALPSALPSGWPALLAALLSRWPACWLPCNHSWLK